MYLFGSAVVENTLVTFAHWSRALLTTIIVIGLAITCSVLALRVNMKADA